MTTAETAEKMKQVARNLIAHKASGGKVDKEALKWAQQLLAANPRQLSTQPEEPYRCNKCGEGIHLWGSKWEVVDGVKQRVGRCCGTTQVFLAKEAA